MTSEVTQAASLIEAEKVSKSTPLEKQYTPEASSESHAQSAAPESTGRSETMPDNGSDAGCSVSDRIKQEAERVEELIYSECFCKPSYAYQDFLEDECERIIQSVIAAAEQRGREKALEEIAIRYETRAIRQKRIFDAAVLENRKLKPEEQAPITSFHEIWFSEALYIRSLKEVKP